MTAGAGVVHAEMPSQRMMREGGQQHGFQIWINLPKADKMIRPRYQDVRADRIPNHTSDDGKVWVKAIAGEAQGINGVVETRIPIGYAHYRVKAGGTVQHAVTDGHTAIVYLMKGKARFGHDRREFAARAAIVFDRHGDTLEIDNVGDDELEFLVLTGQPINEPMVRYGPFVMNTPDELEQAFEDFQSGLMGKMEPLHS
jgi:redox-sensitive bicupin YhaK (pirin superfamily)